MAFRNTRSRTAGTDYQYHLQTRINEVMSLKKAVGALSGSRRSLMRDNETLQARNQELHAEVEALSETNAELSRRMEVYTKYIMAMAARHPREFEEFTAAYHANPEYCVLGPFESDV
jgi:chromosome segregation ATPase